MVSGVKGLNFGIQTNSFSLNSLNSIKSEVSFAETDASGNIAESEQQNLSTDTNTAIGQFGNNKNVLSQQISDLITTKSKPAQASKEAAPNMDLSLDDDIPSPPKV